MRRRLHRAAPSAGTPAEPEPLKPVLRRATPEDLKTHDEVRRSEEDARRKVMERVRAHDLVDEGERHRVAVGPEQAHDLLHRREAGRLPRAGARPRLHLPHPHRAAADRRPRRGGPALRRRALRPGVLLLLLAHRAVAGQPRARQGPAPLAQPDPDLRRLRPAALLPQVRARLLRRGAEALPQGREDASAPRSARRRSSRWTSSASGCSSGARSRAPASSRWSSSRRRSSSWAKCW